MTDTAVVPLADAYRATHYQVLGADGSIVLRVGTRIPAADRALQRLGMLRHWAIVTACNPGSVRLSDADNQRRTQKLYRGLRTFGCRWVPSVNRDPTAAWPDEPGALVLDADDAWLARWARRLGQQAYLAGRLGASPQLVWLK